MRFKTLRKGLGIFLPLPLKDKLEVLRLFAFLNWAHLRLALFPRSWNRHWLRGSPARVSEPSVELPSPLQKVLELMILAARGSLKDATCLRRSLVLRDRLAALGYPAVLVYGVRRGEGKALSAHAWVEVQEFRLDTYGISEAFRPLEVSNLRKDGTDFHA